MAGSGRRQWRGELNEAAVRVAWRERGRRRAGADFGLAMVVRGSADAIAVSRARSSTDGPLVVLRASDGSREDQLGFQNIEGPLQCPADSDVSAVCGPLWPSLLEQIIEPESTTPRDDEENEPSSAGCCAEEGPPPPAALVAWVLGPWLLRRRMLPVSAQNPELA